MTKEITKAYILQEIQDKFKLREMEAAPFLFSETVTPIYNVESHLGKRQIITKDQSISGTGAALFFAVDQTERWLIKAYNVTFLGAGAHTVAGVYYQRGKLTADYMYMDLTAAQTVSYLQIVNPPVLLDPNDKIFINVDGYTSTQDLRLIIDVEKEEIR